MSLIFLQFAVLFIINLYALASNLSESCPSPCNLSCQTCKNGSCFTATNACCIANQCYEKDQIFSNSSLSCLQCQPDKNQTQWSFNPACSAGALCLNKSFLTQNTCPNNVVKEFYEDPDKAVIDFYNLNECGRNQKQCLAGFFTPIDGIQPFACCPGYFCPDGQLCMIPCRPGSYCPSPLQPVDGICQTPVKCPLHQRKDFAQQGCGGSTFEGFCPAESYCPNPTVSTLCLKSTNYCPTGVVNPLSCPAKFKCIHGRATRDGLYELILSTVIGFLFIFVSCVKISQWAILKKKWSGGYARLKHEAMSNYFRERTNNSRRPFKLDIYLSQVKLRDVTRFDPEKNNGFTGRITAGKITALMGSSGCGKTSLLNTIHGRRRLHSGFITFSGHEPLSNLLADYIGYVPQDDIMHKDLTIFETVYYSARARRLLDSKGVIVQDVCFVLDKLGLNNMHNSMIETLSGGQRKRVNIAMEIATRPKVLLLDEPTSGLDTAACDHLFELLQLIKDSEAGPVAIIMVIHQPSYELFQKIDDVLFLTPLCCLAYQGPREQALEHLKSAIFETNSDECPQDRRNDSDTCFIMLTKAEHHLENHSGQAAETIYQQLVRYSWQRRVWLPFFYVMSRSAKQIYLRGVIAEVAYSLAYFLLGVCFGFLFNDKQQDACDIQILPNIYSLVSFAFGVLTCISSQRLFGVEIVDKTYERESRNYFHPFQYWFAKSLVDIFRMILHPLLFLSMFYIEIVPRGSFLAYLKVLLLLQFVCSGIGQLCSVVVNRTEYAYLLGTIMALLSCLLSGFSPRKSDLGSVGFFVTASFSRHIQNLLFHQETLLYVQKVANPPHIWSASVEAIRNYYSFNDNEYPYLWLVSMGTTLRVITLFILYMRSEYRSQRRFQMTHCGPILKSRLCCESRPPDYYQEPSIQ